MRIQAKLYLPQRGMGIPFEFESPKALGWRTLYNAKMAAQSLLLENIEVTYKEQATLPRLNNQEGRKFCDMEFLAELGAPSLSKVNKGIYLKEYSLGCIGSANVLITRTLGTEYTKKDQTFIEELPEAAAKGTGYDLDCQVRVYGSSFPIHIPLLKGRRDTSATTWYKVRDAVCHQLAGHITYETEVHLAENMYNKITFPTRDQQLTVPKGYYNAKKVGAVYSAKPGEDPYTEYYKLGDSQYGL